VAKKEQGPKRIFDIETATLKVMKEQTGLVSKHIVSHIHVRTEGGAKVINISICRKEKLSDLFKLVFPYRESKEFTDPSFFELRTIMPIIAYEHDEARTIDELKFYPKKGLGLFVKSENQVGFRTKSMLNLSGETS
jgi:hypothetical protein